MKNKQSKIIVIGAGLAGLTMAYRLQQKGYDVEVYEARPRVGGRVHSVWQENAEGGFSSSELGAQNITDGGEAKYMHALIKELNLEIQNYDIEVSRVFYDGYKTHDMHELLREQKLDAKEIKAKLKQLAKTSHSIKEVLDQLFPGNPILKRILGIQIAAWEGTKAELLGTCHIKTLERRILREIAFALQDADHKPLLHWVTLKEGNAVLPIKISKLLHNTVHLNKVLKKAQLLQDKKIQLCFADGEQKIADKLILALPCSVYQDIDFDNMVLPMDRLHKIRSVQYGTNAKILIPIAGHNKKHNVVLTDNMVAFFNSDKQLLNLYFAGDAGQNIMQDLSRHYSETLEAIKTNFTIADSMETLPKTAQDEHFGYYSGPIVKSWVDDPYAKGSYSCFDVENNLTREQRNKYRNITVKTMFEPINDQIFFIGEHTSIIYEIGTMEAAIESAERTAKLF